MRSFKFSVLCLFLAGSTSLIYAQRPRKPAAIAKQPAGVSTSPSRKLKISGMNAGRDGILKIETALTMKGPLLISVLNGSNLVKQSSSDSTGRLVRPLEPGETTYLVSLALGPGENIVDVMDANDPIERAALKWTADPRMESRSRQRMGPAPPSNDDEVDDTPDVTVPDPVPPPKKTPKKTPPADKPAKPANELAKYSASRRLSVVGFHDDKQVSLAVGVDPDLNGPITITIIDEAKKVVATRKKELEEAEPSFVETIPLTDGKYTAIVASAGRKEKDETITLGPWTIAAAPPPPPEPPAEFSPNDFQKSKEGHLSAAVTRIDGQSNLKVHVEGLAGFKVKVFNAKGEEVESRTYSNPDDNKNWDLVVKAAEGDHKITVSSLNEKESVDLAVPKNALLKPADAATPVAQEAVEYDWGRVRGYFAGGMIFSKEREDFSKSDIFLDFTIDKNYIARPFFGGLFKDFNTFFNARLTSIPVATAETAETGDGGGEGGGETAEPCNTPDCEGFITSKKAALMQAGIYLPMYGSLTTWYRKVTRQDHSFRWEKNALFVAPLAKGGIMTITGDRETSEGQQFGGDDVFNFYSFGMMLGHYRLHARKQRDGYGNYLTNSFGKPIYEANPNIAPEMISWLTISAGRWENFEIMVPTGQKNALGEEIKVRERPWRVEALGRLKIPETPFIIGFDGNFGKGPDDLRFIFGTRFDIGKLMRTLKLAGQQDQVGQAAPPPADTSTTPPQP
jgi:hypothetical protein